MRIYKENGKVFVELNETLEICDSAVNDTLQTYKEAMIDKVSRRFDTIIANTVLESMKQER